MVSITQFWLLVEDHFATLKLTERLMCKSNEGIIGKSESIEAR